MKDLQPSGNRNEVLVASESVERTDEIAMKSLYTNTFLSPRHKWAAKEYRRGNPDVTIREFMDITAEQVVILMLGKNKHLENVLAVQDKKLKESGISLTRYNNIDLTKKDYPDTFDLK